MAKTTQPKLKVTFVQSREVKPPPRRRLSDQERGLRYDMSQFYRMKAVLEEVFGSKVYRKLKETGRFKDWQCETSRLLDAIRLSIKGTVKIADDEWRDEIADLIEQGQHGIREAETMGDLFAALSSALARITFVQIGMRPSHNRAVKPIPMKPES
jgi:hypothetical protein